jgi:2-polyprenyl-6-hydroxyphenyl methylase/3-demethylubiquinone-9 3-methyltransferase
MAYRGFSFGKNWKFFIEKCLDEKKLNKAIQSLGEFLGHSKISGKSFIDVGCGHGLPSLCAHRLGASKIVSFDIDEDSVECCKYLWEKEGCPPTWQIKKGSILDREFFSNLGKYDVVYSWGVLHHTGNMWDAIKNTVSLVDQKGLLYLAIYNKVDSFIFDSDGRFGTSNCWRRFKEIYSKSPLIARRLVDYSAMAVIVFNYLATFKNPLKKIYNHQELRGMSWVTDIRDWLGGYPYEYATAEEIFHFIKELGFSLEKLKTPGTFRNNEYLFMKR